MTEFVVALETTAPVWLWSRQRAHGGFTSRHHAWKSRGFRSTFLRWLWVGGHLAPSPPNQSLQRTGTAGLPASCVPAAELLLVRRAPLGRRKVWRRLPGSA